VAADHVSAVELRRLLGHPALLDEFVDRALPLLVVDLDDDEDDSADAPDDPSGRLPWALPVVVVGVGERAEPRSAAASVVDVAVGADVDAFERVRRAVARWPIAATSMALLLRDAERRTTAAGLEAESAVYSMLQAGTEFAQWRAEHPVRLRDDDGATVRIERVADTLHLTLDRPSVHNAFSARMRDELYEALLVAASDPTLTVLLDGAGPSFCSGGDLDEFGMRPDPSAAHLVRLARHVGQLLALCCDRVQVVVHGFCCGAGVELPAFASSVTARPGTRFSLPEVSLGLATGAGGSVSVTRRIGRHRTAYLAVSGDVIDAETALSWGLIDAIAEA